MVFREFETIIVTVFIKSSDLHWLLTTWFFCLSLYLTWNPVVFLPFLYNHSPSCLSYPHIFTVIILVTLYIFFLLPPAFFFISLFILSSIHPLSDLNLTLPWRILFLIVFFIQSTLIFFLRAHHCPTYFSLSFECALRLYIYIPLTSQNFIMFYLYAADSIMHKNLLYTTVLSRKNRGIFSPWHFILYFTFWCNFM